jgi:endonuclease/exonuclease/phosphatase family metal-dependent hydrolase
MDAIKRRLIPAAVLAVTLFIISIVFLVNASRVGPLETCLTTCAQYSPGERNEFTVLNLNMLHGYPEFEFLNERIEFIAEHINLISPEVVLLQEVPWTKSTRSTAKYLAEKIGMNYVYLPANGNRQAILFSEGEAILSKYPLKDVEFLELHPRAGFFENRVALKATAVAPWGKIHLVSTHLTDGDSVVNYLQLRSLEQFISDIGDGNFIVAGDFNAVESSDQIQYLTSKWIDTYRLLNPLDQGSTCCIRDLTSPDPINSLDKRIDYIFFKPDQPGQTLTINKSQLGFTYPTKSGDRHLWASDHLGVMTTFAVSTTIDE